MRAKAAAQVLIGVLLMITTSVAPSLGVAVTAPPSLGLTVSVVPSASGVETPIQAGLVNSFALTVKPGSSGTKLIRIQSASSRPELITSSIGYADRINGVLTLEDGRTSDIAPWFKFDSPQITLKPLQSVDLTVSITVPVKEPIGIREAYLLVKASDPSYVATKHSITFFINNRVNIIRIAI